MAVIMVGITAGNIFTAVDSSTLRRVVRESEAPAVAVFKEVAPTVAVGIVIISKEHAAPQNQKMMKVA
jgi:hypothetical protein